MKNNTILITALKKHIHKNPISNKAEKRIAKIRSETLKAHKSLNTLLKKMSSTDNRASIITNILKDRNGLDTFLKGVYTLEVLPEKILGLSRLLSYESCQLLIHERGKLTVNSYSYHRLSGRVISDYPISNFNQIFNIIKKSKNRLFNQSQVIKEAPEILGTFLAKDFSLKMHNIVFIISRNDFLPPTTLEQTYFDELGALLAPLFNSLLFQDQIFTKNQFLQIALKLFPAPLKIENSEQSLQFKNEAFDQDKDLKSNNYSKIEKFPLSKNRSMLIYSAQETLSPDIYHFQRVKLLGELLNTLQHELNNPLFGVKLAADLLEENLEITDREFIQDISNNCTRCQEIIANFSHLYSDQMDFPQINIKNVVYEALTLAKSEMQGIKSEVKFIGTVDEILPSVNPVWLNQILFNLIINSSQAIKESAKDCLRHHKISIQIKEFDPDKQISISVTDTGPGISQEQVRKVFSPFYTTRRKGTGLGLSICQNLAYKLGGKIILKNNSPSPGATFSLILPLQ